MTYNSPKTGQQIDDAVTLSEGPLFIGYTGQVDIVIPNADTWVNLDIPLTVEGAMVRGFGLPVGPGIEYTGDDPVIVQVSGPFSIASNTNNVITQVAVGKNDVPFVGSTVHRKIANAGDVGAAGFEYLVPLVKGDRITIHVQADEAVTLTVRNAAVNIIAVATNGH